MATRKQAYTRAAKLGCTITETGDSVSLDLPLGKVLAGSGLHYYDIRDIERWKMADVWDAIIEEMEMGIENCTTTGCDVCTE